MDEPLTPAPDTEGLVVALRKRMRRIVRQPLVLAAVLAAAGATGGFVAAALLDTSQRTHENIQLASVTLVFGALLGGVVKVLLDDVQHARERRAEQTRFIAKMLDDLKSVYDRVERTRILLPAHRSALTYGKEMRDLIDARVQLRNVIRAIDSQTSGISTEIVGDLARAVEEMEGYLEELTDEFQVRYTQISDRQKIYEARVTGRLKMLENDARAADPYRELGEKNEAWEEIAAELSAVKQFIGDWSKAETPSLARTQSLPTTPSPYKERFENPLDLASWLLRSELQKPGKTRRRDIPVGTVEADGLKAIADHLQEKKTYGEPGSTQASPHRSGGLSA